MTLPPFVSATDHVLKALEPTLAPVPIYGRPPAGDPTQTRPDEFFVLRRIGGTEDHIVSDGAQFFFEAWAQTSARAEQLLQIGREAARNLPGQTSPLVPSVPFYRYFEISGPADLWDLDSDTPRQRMTFRLALRAVT